jgi:tRNA-dihydrouridine synthase A
VDALYVHARKAWLKGLSPKENRTIPPLEYPRVYRLKQRLSDLQMMINGGIETLEQADEHLQHMDGVMLGRAAYHNPMLMAEVDARLFGDAREIPDFKQIMALMADYAEGELAKGTRLNNIARHMLGLANGRPGARQFRQIMSVDACKANAGPEVFMRALACVEERSLEEAV